MLKILIWVAAAVAMTQVGVVIGIIKAEAPVKQSPRVVARSGKILVWVDRDGKEERIPVPADEYRHPRISPDGTTEVVRAESHAV